MDIPLLVMAFVGACSAASGSIGCIIMAATRRSSGIWFFATKLLFWSYLTLGIAVGTLIVYSQGREFQ